MSMFYGEDQPKMIVFSFLFDGLSIFRHEIVSAQGQLYNRAEGVTYFIVFNSQCLRPPQQRSKGVEPIGLIIFWFGLLLGENITTKLL